MCMNMTLCNVTSEKDLFFEVPSQYLLNQNYPNPFNTETRNSYEVAKNTQVTLKIINLQDQHVRTLVNEEKPAGFHEVVWDGKNDHGQRMKSGVYLYRLEGMDSPQIRKMLLL